MRPKNEGDSGVMVAGEMWWQRDVITDDVRRGWEEQNGPIGDDDYTFINCQAKDGTEFRVYFPPYRGQPLVDEAGWLLTLKCDPR